MYQEGTVGPTGTGVVAHSKSPAPGGVSEHGSVQGLCNTLAHFLGSVKGTTLGEMNFSSKRGCAQFNLPGSDWLGASQLMLPGRGHMETSPSWAYFQVPPPLQEHFGPVTVWAGKDNLKMMVYSPPASGIPVHLPKQPQSRHFHCLLSTKESAGKGLLHLSPAPPWL